MTTKLKLGKMATQSSQFHVGTGKRLCPLCRNVFTKSHTCDECSHNSYAFSATSTEKNRGHH